MADKEESKKQVADLQTRLTLTDEQEAHENEEQEKKEKCRWMPCVVRGVRDRTHRSPARWNSKKRPHERMRRKVLAAERLMTAHLGDQIERLEIALDEYGRDVSADDGSGRVLYGCADDAAPGKASWDLVLESPTPMVYVWAGNRAVEELQAQADGQYSSLSSSKDGTGIYDSGFGDKSGRPSLIGGGNTTGTVPRRRKYDAIAGRVRCCDVGGRAAAKIDASSHGIHQGMRRTTDDARHECDGKNLPPARRIDTCHLLLQLMVIDYNPNADYHGKVGFAIE